MTGVGGVWPLGRQTQGPKSFREHPLPSLGARQTGRNLFLPHLYAATKETSFPPETHSVNSNIGTSPAPSTCPFSQKSPSSPPPPPLSRGLVSQSQTFTVHTCLPQTVFLSTSVSAVRELSPKHHAPYIQITHSVCLLSFLYACCTLSSSQINKQQQKKNLPNP